MVLCCLVGQSFWRCSSPPQRRQRLARSAFERCDISWLNGHFEALRQPPARKKYLQSPFPLPVGPLLADPWLVFAALVEEDVVEAPRFFTFAKRVGAPGFAAISDSSSACRCCWYLATSAWDGCESIRRLERKSCVRNWVSGLSAMKRAEVVVSALANTDPSGTIIFRSRHLCIHLGHALSQVKHSSIVSNCTAFCKLPSTVDRSDAPPG